MKKKPLYLFNDTAATVPFESTLRLKDKMDELVKTNNARVVYLYETEMEAGCDSEKSAECLVTF